MNNWLHNLSLSCGWRWSVSEFCTSSQRQPTPWSLMLAVGERARSFKAIAPIMLPPLCIIFRAFRGVHRCAVARAMNVRRQAQRSG